MKNFPKGKLNKYDEGNLAIAIGTSGSNIIIEFGKPVKWIGLGRDEAIALGNSLLKRALELSAEEAQQ